MDVPSKIASNTVQEYFTSIGCECPTTVASQLMCKLLVDRRTHRWLNCNDVVDAEMLLHRHYFNVDDFVENFLKIQLQIEPLHRYDTHAGAPVFGFALPKKRSIAICERTLDYEPLYRASILHEVGHVLLHAEQNEDMQCYSPRSTRRPLYERDADEFMLMALCPDSILEIAIALSAQFRGLNLSDILNKANGHRGRWMWRDIVFPYLLDHICVSRELLAIRLREKGFFNQDTVDYHLSYRMETRWTSNLKRGSLRVPLMRILRELTTPGTIY